MLEWMIGLIIIGSIFAILQIDEHFANKADTKIIQAISSNKDQIIVIPSGEIILHPPRSDGRIRIKSIRADGDVKIRVTNGGTELFIDGRKIELDKDKAVK